jgi:hypothetical protein
MTIQVLRKAPVRLGRKLYLFHISLKHCFSDIALAAEYIRNTTVNLSDQKCAPNEEQK